MKKKMGQNAHDSEVNAAFQVVAELFHGNIAYEGNARYKALWHRDNFSHFLKHQDHLVRPITIEFWPSLSCNARCSLCPYRRNKARQDVDQSPERTTTTLKTACQVARQLSAFGALSVLLTGGGEPFFNPDIDKIAQIFRESGLKIGVYTNGTVPEREQQIRNIVALEPQFVRVSVNAGSALEHYREYHIEPYQGTSSWEMLKRNSLIFLDAIARCSTDTTFGFSFILLGNEPPASYVGMANFIRNIHQAAGEKPLFAHFRPKILYYNDDGTVVTRVPNKLAQGIARIPEMVERYVMPNLPSSPALTIQTNTYASDLVTAAEPTSCFSTGWCTSFNHLGKGYVISELCGTKWEGAQWGDLRVQTMEDAWFSLARLQIHLDYARGIKKVPIYNKLTGIQNLLSEIRAAAPRPFTEPEVKQFWELFDKAGFKKPRSWDFI